MQFTNNISVSATAETVNLRFEYIDPYTKQSGILYSVHMDLTTASRLRDVLSEAVSSQKIHNIIGEPEGRA